VESGNLKSTIVGRKIGLYRATPNCKHRSKGFSDSIKNLTPFENTLSFDIPVKQRIIHALQTDGQAQLV
jgi:hypothetical protein